jgi:hypothetical protein
VDSFLKWGSLVLLVCSFILLIALVFSASDPDYSYLATQIDQECRSNQP